MLKEFFIFKDHMVLQRGTAVSIWGRSDPYQKVTVRYQGQQESAISNKEGKWQVALAPLHVDYGSNMLIMTKNVSHLLKDVAVGDVWFAGGQSNMEFQMRFEDHYEREKRIENTNIRFFDFPEITYAEQLKEKDYFSKNGFWRIDNKNNLAYFSAVAYYFAKQVERNIGIPIGIIGCNFGGTSILSWMSKRAILAGNGQKYLNKYQEEIRGLDIKKYFSNFKAESSNYRNDLFADETSNYLLAGKSIEEIKLLYRQKNSSMPPWPTKEMGPANENAPTVLYHSMIKPLINYKLKGFLWYQGENDSPQMPNEEYRDLFIALIEEYRKLWKNKKSPFYFVQLAPFKEWFNLKWNFTNIRRQQQEVEDLVPNTGMAVITDCGMKDDIHPKNKELVGQRLANLAEILISWILMLKARDCLKL